MGRVALVQICPWLHSDRKLRRSRKQMDAYALDVTPRGMHRKMKPT